MVVVITLTMTNGGNSIQLTVTDECPSCGDGHVEMGIEVLSELVGIKEACAIGLGLPQVDWSFDSVRGGGGNAGNDGNVTVSYPQPLRRS